MMATEQWVWLPHDELVWTPAAVLSNDGSYTRYRTVQGDELSIANNRLVLTSLEGVSATSKEGLVENLVNLDEMGEGAVIHALRTRYNTDEIYTNIGPILVSINPYKQLPIYSASTISKYPPSSAPHSTAPPHVFAIAAAAYHQLMTQHEDQAIIISGESGAGKTEATKTVLSYLSEITQKSTDTDSNLISTPQQILLSNPILESFGNSKTLRNNNSSRFGKYMQINISLKTGSITSAKIYNYLLEKSRVTQVTKNERNYHIFYQLCCGLESKQKQRVGLLNVEDYSYLSQSSCLTIDGVNDGRDWETTLDALQQLSFSLEEINTIISILAAILQLGNLSFHATRINNMDATEIIDTNLLSTIANNLQMSTDELATCIRFRSVTIRNETSMIPLNLEDTIDSRDALSKALYDRLFNWIVDRLNTTLLKTSNANSNNNSLEKYKSIGILDIFGFEIFEKNLFEQFCINYANEKLQQHFNTHIFKLEKEIYAAEKIIFDSKIIDFIDNLECVNLIESKAGIIKSMEEEIMLPQGSDKSMVEKFHAKYYNKSKYYDVIKKNPNTFIIKHYAGDVSYDSQGMLNKNKDKLHEIIETSMKKSTSTKLIEIWENLEKMELLRQRELAALQAELEEKNNNNGAKNYSKTMTGTMTMGANKKKVFSLGTQFAQQLQLLMSILNACQPHYIRCIKPNFQKKNNCFNSNLVMTQLSYAGLFNAIKVRKSGFAYRKEYSTFLKEYRVLLHITELQTMLSKYKNPREQCEYLCRTVLAKSLNVNDYQFGVTKIFMRNNQRIILAELKNIALTAKTIILQAAFRGVLARRLVKELKKLNTECMTIMNSSNIREQKDNIKRIMDRCTKKNYQLFIIKRLKIALEFFIEEERLRTIMNDSLIPPLTSGILEAALNAYEHLAAKIPTYIKMLPDLIDKEKKISLELTRIMAIEEKRKLLRNAIMEESVISVEQILNDLATLQVDPNDSELMNARDLLKEWLIEEEKWAVLRSALKSNNVDQIESAVDTVRKLTRTDEQKQKLIQEARDALFSSYSSMLEAAISSADDEHMVRKKLMPKLEQLQFVELVYRAQEWLDEQDRLRVLEKQRRSSLVAIPSSNSVAPGGIPPDVPSTEDDALTRQHNAEKEKRLQQMKAIQRKRASTISRSDDGDFPPPPPPPTDDGIPPPPSANINISAIPSVADFDPDMEEFFPPPPSNDGETRDQSLQLAMHYKDYTALSSLLGQCRAVNHNSRIVRMSENVLKQWKEEEKIRDMIAKIREDGWQDEEGIKDIIKKASLIGMNEAAEIKELRYIVFTMTPIERLEMRLQYARERENIPLLLYLLSQANDEEYQSDKINEIRLELESMGVSGGARDKAANKGRGEESREERYKRFIETYTGANNNQDNEATGSKTNVALSLPLSLSAFPFLRRPNSYAKHSILHKERVKAMMLKHQKDELPTSLLFLSTAACNNNRKESIRIKNVAKNMFKNIKGYMGDAYHPYPVSLAYEVVMTGVNEPMLRDEIFCQLIKQTTENPHQASLLLGFKLLYLCLATYSPSVSLSPFILSHLALFALSALPECDARFDSVDAVATNCWIVWETGERDRENREREINERKEKGEVIDERRLKEQDRARMKVPSMQDIERLTNGTLVGANMYEDIAEPISLSATSSRYNTMKAGSSSGTQSPHQTGASSTAATTSPLLGTSRPLTVGNPSYAHTLSVTIPPVIHNLAQSPSPRSPFMTAGNNNNIANKLNGTLKSPISVQNPSTPPAAIPMSARSGSSDGSNNGSNNGSSSTNNNVTYNYSPLSPSPTSGDGAAEESPQSPTPKSVNSAARNLPTPPTITTTATTAGSNTIQAKKSIPPPIIFNTTSPMTRPANTSSSNNRSVVDSAAPPPPPLLSLKISNNNSSTQPPQQLSPRSAPPALPAKSAGGSVPSSPAINSSIIMVPTPPPLLSQSRKGPPPMPVNVSTSAPVAPAPLSTIAASKAPTMTHPMNDNSSSPPPPPGPPGSPFVPTAVPPSAPSMSKKGPPALPSSKKGPPPITQTTPHPPPPPAHNDDNAAFDNDDEGGRDALLESIRKGRRMKQVGPPPEKSLKERLGM